MELKLSNKTFYKRHYFEIEKFLISNKSLHITNEKSKNKFEYHKFNNLFLKYEKNNLTLNIDKIKNQYETIVLSDILENCYDINLLFNQSKKILQNNGKLVVTSVNSNWNIIVKIFEKLKLKQPNVRQSYIHTKKIKNIADGAGFEMINFYTRQIIPFKLLFLGNLLNKILESTFSFLNIGIKSYIVFRKRDSLHTNYSKSILIPAKNEEGNLVELVNRIPKNYRYELVISCGDSQDKTLDVANQISKNEKLFNVKVIEQTGNGKANAVWEALEVCSGEVIAILDADISVDPETIDEFFEIIDNNYGDFVNGTRLIYQMEKGAMRHINLIGNRLFQNIVSIIAKRKLTDSLCGTKVFKRDLISKLNWWQNTNKLHDPFGDFDLIFTAAYFSEKIIEFPIHYKSRTYGKTQISRFRDGLKLIKYLLLSFFIFNSSKN